jgi:hypothetical protein
VLAPSGQLNVVRVSTGDYSPAPMSARLIEAFGAAATSVQLTYSTRNAAAAKLSASYTYANNTLIVTVSTGGGRPGMGATVMRGYTDSIELPRLPPGTRIVVQHTGASNVGRTLVDRFSGGCAF